METIKLDRAGLTMLYHRGYFDADALLDQKTTLLVLDCRSLGLKNCSSLILDAKRGIIISDKETTRLVNQFIKTRPVGFFPGRVCVYQQAKKFPCLPYVWGETQLMPLSGYTRHATSWIMFNQVYYNYFVDQDHLATIFANNASLRYLIPLNKKTYLNNLKTTRLIYNKLHCFVRDLVKDFDLNGAFNDPLLQLEATELWPPDFSFLDAYLSLILDLIYREEGIVSKETLTHLINQFKQKYDRL